MATRLFHVPPSLAVHGFTRRRKKFQAAGGLERLPPLFPSLPAVKATSPAKAKKTQQLFLFYFSLLRSGSSGSDSRFVVLSLFRWMICRGGTNVVSEEAALL